MKTGVGVSLRKMFKNKSGCRGKCRPSREYIISLLTSGFLSRGVGPQVRPNGAVLATAALLLLLLLLLLQLPLLSFLPLLLASSLSLSLSYLRLSSLLRSSSMPLSLSVLLSSLPLS